MPHISIKAQTIFEVFGFPVTNSLLSSAIVLILFFLLVVRYNREAANRTKGTLFYFMTFTLRSIYGLFESVFESKTSYFFPLVGAFFVFILLQNWFGLLPGVGSVLIGVAGHGERVPLLRGPTADLNTTLALALISVIYSQYVGIAHLGFFSYVKKFINLSSPMNFFVGIIETISEFSKLVSFSFRLFGNIFAGEVIIVIVAFLVPVFVSAPFFIFEVFIGLIQAIVFSMLSAVFFNLAMQKADH